MRAVTRRTSSAAAAWSGACRQCTATETDFSSTRMPADPANSSRSVAAA
jgi:hypothetical protein